VGNSTWKRRDNCYLRARNAGGKQLPAALGTANQNLQREQALHVVAVDVVVDVVDVVGVVVAADVVPDNVLVPTLNPSDVDRHVGIYYWISSGAKKTLNGQDRASEVYSL
jgi:hypothetical protein